MGLEEVRMGGDELKRMRRDKTEERKQKREASFNEPRFLFFVSAVFG